MSAASRQLDNVIDHEVTMLDRLAAKNIETGLQDPSFKVTIESTNTFAKMELTLTHAEIDALREILARRSR